MALEFNGSSSRVVYNNIGNLNSGAKSILLDFFLPGSDFQPNNDFFSATRNSGTDTFQNFLLQLSDEGGTNNSVRAAHFGSVTGQAYTSSDVLTVGQWNRIVWTCSDCATPSVLNTKIYVNGLSQAIFGGSTGAGLGVTNGDVCIGNRAHLDRGIKGRIARFAVIDRVANEIEIERFELGLKLEDIFAINDFLLKPDTEFLANWDSVINNNTNSAFRSGTIQVQDPTYGLASLTTPLSVTQQSALAEKSATPIQGALVGQTDLAALEQRSSVVVVPTAANIGIAGDFDGGTVDDIASSIELSSMGAVITLTPRKFPYRDARDNWLTMQARITGIESPDSIQFQLSDSDFDLGQKFTSETKLWWRPVSSTKDEWVLFENNVLENGVITASNNTNFNTAEIYVADQPGYYYGDIVSDVEAWLAHPYVTPPMGAGIDGSISTLTSVTDENGRSSGQLKQHAIRITDEVSPSHPELNRKLRVLVFANIHSGEMVGKWAVKGFVDWLIGNSNKASKTRENFEVFVVWVNSTGLFLGHPVGSEITGVFANKNVNRDWGDFDLEVTKRVRDWVTLNLENDISYIIDFHNLTWSIDDRIFREPTKVSLAFSDALDANYSGGVTQQLNSATSGFTTFYYRSNYGIEGATLEPRRGTNSLANYKAFGAAAGQALQDVLDNGAFGRFASVNSDPLGWKSNAYVSVENTKEIKRVISELW